MIDPFPQRWMSVIDPCVKNVRLYLEGIVLLELYQRRLELFSVAHLYGKGVTLEFEVSFDDQI